MLSSLHSQLPIRYLLGEAIRVELASSEDQKATPSPSPRRLARAKDLPEQRAPTQIDSRNVPGPCTPSETITFLLEGDKTPQDPTTATALNASKAADLS